MNLFKRSKSLMLWMALLVILPSIAWSQVSGCPQGITSYWKLDESTGTVFTDYIGTIDGSCTNGSCPTIAPGRINGGQYFDGATTAINIPSDNSFNWAATDSFSVEVWIKGIDGQTCTAAGIDNNEVIIGRYDGAGFQWWIGCWNTTGTAIFRLGDTNNTYLKLEGPPINDGNWHHIVAIRNSEIGSNLLYVDGQLVASQAISYTAGFDSTVDLNVGHLSDAFHFQGTIDEVALYNRVLSENEVKQHYNDGAIGLRWGYCGCASAVRIMPLGDSITRGYNADNPTEFIGFRRKLFLDLEAAGFKIDLVGGLEDGPAFPDFDIEHEGHGGWHADGSGTGQDIAPNVYSFLTANPADVVLLHIGTNDITVGGQSVTEIETILDEIDRFSTDANVLLARIISRTDGTDTDGDGLDDTTFTFNNAVQQMANTRITNEDKIIVVDHESALDYTTDMSDSIHPNQTGYDKMATVWYNTLSSFLPVCGDLVPSITSVPIVEGGVGGSYSYNVDASGNPLPTYSLTSPPTGMTIDTNSGLISWQPSTTGVYGVTVEASNSSGTDTQTYDLDIVKYPTGITHYWKLDENASPFNDYYGTNNATCTNCPTLVLGQVNSQQQYHQYGALQFDGANDALDVLDDNSFDWAVDDSFSIEFWMKGVSGQTCAGSGIDFNEVVVGRDNGSGLQWWIGCWNSTGEATFRLSDNTGDAVKLTGPSITDGQWHHIVAVRDGSTGKNLLYVDGQLAASQTYSYQSGFDAQADLNIGYLNNSFFFTGTIDEVALYNKALTSAEILKHYNDGQSGIGYRALFFTITVVTPTNGTISCDKNSVEAGDSTTCTITPDAGYELQQLLDNNSDVTGSVFGDTYIISNVQENHTLDATFSPITYLLTVSKSGLGSGTVTSVPTGIDCGTDCTETYGSGTSVTLTASPDASSIFAGWDGGGCTGTATTCQITMDQARNVAAQFDIKIYTITATAGTNGSINPSGAVTVNHGESQSFLITPDTGYHVADVVVDGSSVGAVTSYTFSNVTANHTIEATFAINQYTISTNVLSGQGTLRCDSPVNYNDSSTCTVSPATGYHLVSLTDNGTDVTASVSNGEYTISNVSESHTVEATFAINIYTVTATAGAGGSISPSGNVQVTHGETKTFAVTADTGYHIESVTGCGGTLTGNTFTTGPITSDCTVTASFAIDAFTITTSSNGNGTISCTPSTVDYNSSSTCTITPDSGYYLVKLTDNGSDVTTSVSGNSYTIGNVKEDHTIVATFALNVTYTITTTVAKGDGTLSCNPATVIEDSSTTCSITTGSGYHLLKLLDNSVDVTNLIIQNIYSIENVQEDHSIEVFFVSDNNQPPSVPKLLYPADGDIIDGTTVTFRWEASSDPDKDPVNYTLYYCEDQNFTNCNPVKIASTDVEKRIYFAGIGGFGVLLLFGAIFSGDLSRRRKLALFIAALILSAFILSACGSGGGSGNNVTNTSSGDNTSTTSEVSYTANDLSTGTTYYWKVVADDGNGAQAESEVGSFTTQ